MTVILATGHLVSPTTGKRDDVGAGETTNHETEHDGELLGGVTEWSGKGWRLRAYAIPSV
jgi:hypothetical protein